MVQGTERGREHEPEAAADHGAGRKTDGHDGGAGRDERDIYGADADAFARGDAGDPAGPERQAERPGEPPPAQKKTARAAAGLLRVKSLVALVLTGAFAYMAVTGRVSQDFMTVYVVIIAFYFGTRPQKTGHAAEGEDRKK